MLFMISVALGHSCNSRSVRCSSMILNCRVGNCARSLYGWSPSVLFCSLGVVRKCIWICLGRYLYLIYPFFYIAECSRCLFIMIRVSHSCIYEPSPSFAYHQTGYASSIHPAVVYSSCWNHANLQNCYPNSRQCFESRFWHIVYFYLDRFPPRSEDSTELFLSRRFCSACLAANCSARSLAICSRILLRCSSSSFFSFFSFSKYNLFCRFSSSSLVFCISLPSCLRFSSLSLTCCMCLVTNWDGFANASLYASLLACFSCSSLFCRACSICFFNLGINQFSPTSHDDGRDL